MNKFADLLEENIDELARLESIAMGQPLSVAKVFIGLCAPGWRCERFRSFLNIAEYSQIMRAGPTRSAARCFQKMAMGCTNSFAMSLLVSVQVLQLGTVHRSSSTGRSRQLWQQEIL